MLLSTCRLLEFSLKFSRKDPYFPKLLPTPFEIHISREFPQLQNSIHDMSTFTCSEDLHARSAAHLDSSYPKSLHFMTPFRSLLIDFSSPNSSLSELTEQDLGFQWDISTPAPKKRSRAHFISIDAEKMEDYFVTQEFDSVKQDMSLSWRADSTEVAQGLVVTCTRRCSTKSVAIKDEARPMPNSDGEHILSRIVFGSAIRVKIEISGKDPAKLMQLHRTLQMELNFAALKRLILEDEGSNSVSVHVLANGQKCSRVEKLPTLREQLELADKYLHSSNSEFTPKSVVIKCQFTQAPAEAAQITPIDLPTPKDPMTTIQDRLTLFQSGDFKSQYPEYALQLANESQRLLKLYESTPIHDSVMLHKNATSMRDMLASITGEAHLSFSSCIERSYRGHLLDSLPYFTGTSYLRGQMEYHGTWLQGVRHGTGEKYDSNGRLVYRGTWKYGLCVDRHWSITVYRWKTSAFFYEGEAPSKRSKRRQGYGLCTLKSGGEYEGEFDNDKFDGYGEFRSKTGPVLRYDGYWHAGKKQGKGVCVYSSGEIFEGEFFSGSRHGLGTLLTTQGDEYDGQWSENLYHGQGKLSRKSDGSIYEGEFVKGKRHGMGRLTRNDGSCYDGEWTNDAQSGVGIFYYESGSKYTGDWLAGVMHGRGSYEFANGDKYEGQWKNGLMHGKGTYEFANGDKYEGQWKADQKHGKGRFSWIAKGTPVVYIGSYKDNRKHGKGVVMWPDGSKVEGIWRRGYRT